MDFNLPPELVAYLGELDAFIEHKIKPLERKDDNIRFFDHRREWARTDWDRGGLPRHEWEELLGQARKLADEAGHLVRVLRLGPGAAVRVFDGRGHEWDATLRATT